MTGAILLPLKSAGLWLIKDGILGEQGRKDFRRYFWRDFPIGFILMSIVGLVFAIQISKVSNLPPEAGIATHIIGNILGPIFGSGNGLVLGVAAGMAKPIGDLVYDLGHGDLTQGYYMYLVVVQIVAVGMLITVPLRLALRIGKYTPHSALDGMLAFIGFFLLIKQMVDFLGIHFSSRHLDEMLVELPWLLSDVDAAAVIIAGSTLGVMILTAVYKDKLPTRLQAIPPHFYGIITGIIVSYAIIPLGLSEAKRIVVAANMLGNLPITPDYGGLWRDSSVWGAALELGILIWLIDTGETVGNAKNCCERHNLGRRDYCLNKIVFAVGLSNLFVPFAGGGNQLPGAIKGELANAAEMKTNWGSFYSALGILAILALAAVGIGLLSILPNSALASVMVYTAWGMVWRVLKKLVAFVRRPSQWANWQDQWDHLIVPSFTFAVCFYTDELAIGLAAGAILHYALKYYFERGNRTDVVMEGATS